MEELEGKVVLYLITGSTSVTFFVIQHGKAWKMYCKQGKSGDISKLIYLKYTFSLKCLAKDIVLPDVKQSIQQVIPYGLIWDGLLKCFMINP